MTSVGHANCVRIGLSLATIACANLIAIAPLPAQAPAEIGVGSTVRVVHARCFLCLRRSEAGFIASITSDSVHLARAAGSTGVAVRDVRRVGTPAPISRTNGAIAGAQNGFVWGVALGVASAAVARTRNWGTSRERTLLVPGTVGAFTLGGTIIGAARRSTR